MRITKVYTRAGDGGKTRLGGGQEVAKDAPRIEAMGAADEVNSLLGVALASGLVETLAPFLGRVQNDLFHLGADLCLLEEDKPARQPPHIEHRHIDRLEKEIDRLQERLPPLEEFILPGGSVGAAHLHLARAACRRAERVVVALARAEPVGAHIVPYLNRLSDYLFVAAREQNRATGARDVSWDQKL